MATTPMVQRPTPRASDRPGPSAGGLEKLAWLMDRAIVIPGTNVRVGLDALIGLLPVGGDVMTGLIQAGLVLYAASHYKLPRAVVARMVTNVLLDVGIGSIPLVGDIFDVFFKANTRNMALIREVHAQEVKGEPVKSAPSVRYLIGIGAAMGAALVLVLIGFVALIVWATRAADRGLW